MSLSANPFYQRDVISTEEFPRSELEYLFDFTDRIMEMERSERMSLAEGKVLGYMFFEPSTRTRLSFEAAMLSIGGRTIGFSEPQTSSVAKGETLADTVRVMDGYVDVMVLRHPRDGAARFAAEMAKKPLINGGSGSEEHPTQAMLDLYCIRKLLGRIDGISIGLVGDMKHARVIRSLLYAFSRYNCHVYLISPPELTVREDVKLNIGSLKVTELSSFDHVIGDLDVLYTLRVQKERFSDPAQYEKVKSSYYIDRKTLERCKSSLILLHPLPRVGELSTDVDETPHAKFFQQAAWGKDLRAAMLISILG